MDVVALYKSHLAPSYVKKDLVAQMELWSAPLHYEVGTEGRGGWTAPIVCWGEGAVGARRFGLLEAGSTLWMGWKERRAGQSQPLGIGVELEWSTPRIRWRPKQSSTGFQCRTFLCEGQAWWLATVPTQYRPAAGENLWCNFPVSCKPFLKVAPESMGLKSRVLYKLSSRWQVLPIHCALDKSSSGMEGMEFESHCVMHSGTLWHHDVEQSLVSSLNYRVNQTFLPSHY